MGTPHQAELPSSAIFQRFPPLFDGISDGFDDMDIDTSGAILSSPTCTANYAEMSSCETLGQALPLFREGLENSEDHEPMEIDSDHASVLVQTPGVVAGLTNFSASLAEQAYPSRTPLQTENAVESVPKRCDEGHLHGPWPTMGPIDIAKCERECNYCSARRPEAKLLRKHVKAVHIGRGKMDIRVVHSTSGRRRADIVATKPVDAPFAVGQKATKCIPPDPNTAVKVEASSFCASAPPPFSPPHSMSRKRRRLSFTAKSSDAGSRHAAPYATIQEYRDLQRDVNMLCFGAKTLKALLVETEQTLAAHIRSYRDVRRDDTMLQLVAKVIEALVIKIQPILALADLQESRERFCYLEGELVGIWLNVALSASVKQEWKALNAMQRRWAEHHDYVITFNHDHLTLELRLVAPGGRWAELSYQVRWKSLRTNTEVFELYARAFLHPGSVRAKVHGYTAIFNSTLSSWTIESFKVSSLFCELEGIIRNR